MQLNCFTTFRYQSTLASRQLLMLVLFSFCCHICSPKTFPKYNKEKEKNDSLKDEAKRQLLKLLGLHDLPTQANHVLPHKYMFHIYHKMSTRHYNAGKVNTIRGFVDVGNVDSSENFHQMYSFNISALPRSEKLKSAKLRLLRLWTKKAYRYIWTHGMIYRAKLYFKQETEQIWNGYKISYEQLTPLGSILFDIRNTSEKWMVFNVKKALNLWHNSNTNILHNMEVQIESITSGHLMPSYDFGLSESDREYHQKALLVSFTNDERIRSHHNTTTTTTTTSTTTSSSQLTMEDGEKRRVKRGSSRRKRKKYLCDRKELYVDFATLGWSDEILAPRGYNAYFCHGYCTFPMPEHLKPTNHAVVKTTVHNVQRRVPPACCVPHKLSGMSMLYRDGGNSVSYKKYDNMVVESCGCK